jgi:outer membrane protein TolC
MIKKKLVLLIYICLLAVFSAYPFSAHAQQEMSREERIKALELLKKEENKAGSALGISVQSSTSEEENKFELPPLSVFLDAVTENATVKKARSQVEQQKNEYRIEKRNWLNYFRLNGNYSYGKYNILSNASDEYTPMYQTSMSNAQQNFNVGASVSVGIGDLVNRPLKLKSYKYNIEQLQYVQDEVMEERKLKILEAYNAVTEQLATIKAKAETAALYNAQMKICEYNFINGTLNITELAFERSKRSGAVTAYEQSRVALHNAIILLEMLTNVKIIKEK